jgi:hypothetical protein
MKQATLPDFLTAGEIDRCVVLFREHGPHRAFIDAVTREITAPNIARIDRALGQPNDPRYLAYAVQYVLFQASAAKETAQC